MKTAIRALIVEESKIWAQTMVEMLEREHFDVHYDQVISRNDFLNSIIFGAYDVILCNFALPGWDGELAYVLHRESRKDTPFVIVTSSLDQEKAGALLKLGVDDLVMKDHIYRLPFAVHKLIERKRLSSGHKQAEELREFSELKFYEILEKSEQALFGYDEMGVIIFWNRRCHDIFNFTADQVIGKNVAAIGFPTPDFLCWKRVKEIFEGKSLPVSDWSMENGGKNRRHFHACHYGIKGGNGKVVLGVTTTSDVTERVVAEELAAQSRKTEVLEQLAGSIAHDFNNQLTIMFGNLHIAMKKVEADPELSSILSEVENAARNCVGMTKKLLSFRKKTEAKKKEIVDMHLFLDDFKESIQPLLPANMKTEIRKGADRFWVNLLPAAIRQVLMDLVVNARDAMPNGGTLIIETRNVYFDEQYASKNPEFSPGQFFCISVTDTGCGIPTEIMPRVFEPYFTTKKEHQTTSLGLSAVYNIMKSLGGWISVYSEINVGTTFKIYLPIFLGITEEAENKNGMTKIQGGAEAILVADDEEAICNLTKAILKQKGYHVLLAKDGEETVNACKEMGWEIDLIILDYTMPKLSAVETIEKIRAIHPHAKIIVSSGYSLTDEVSNNLSALGAKAFIQKPYQFEEFISLVRSVLDGKSEPIFSNKKEV